jgi:hypothetical protein
MSDPHCIHKPLMIAMQKRIALFRNANNRLPEFITLSEKDETTYMQEVYDLLTPGMIRPEPDSHKKFQKVSVLYDKGLHSMEMYVGPY